MILNGINVKDRSFQPHNQQFLLTGSRLLLDFKGDRPAADLPWTVIPPGSEGANMKDMLSIIAGVICGYAAMVVLITLVQETWFGGVGWGITPVGTLLVAGFFTMLAAAVGAVLATAIARSRRRLPALIMSVLVGIETTTLVLTGRVGGPLWFDVLAALSLVFAILVGAELFLRYVAPRHE
jgi:hypothetical protein